MSVGEPIKDSVLNRGGLLMFAGLAVLAVLVIIVIAILIAVLHH
ncbi:MAG TPA: hypothetical protein VLS53_05555 [Candidatus Dormibacteraeota bacterium]|nr:hypothetical protein [Candidatus Dormibacteraeota bacterium]